MEREIALACLVFDLESFPLKIYSTVAELTVTQTTRVEQLLVAINLSTATALPLSEFISTLSIRRERKGRRLPPPKVSPSFVAGAGRSEVGRNGPL